MGKINALHCAELLDQDASEKQIPPGLEPSKKEGSVGLEQVVRQVGANQIIFCLDHWFELRQITPTEADLR